MSRTLKCHDHHPTNGRKDAGPHCSLVQRGLQSLGYFSKHKSGSAVIEFAFIAPILVFFVAVLGVIGIELRDFIKLDQILTAGAAVAISDPGDDAVVLRMRQVALAHGYTVADGPIYNGDDRLSIMSARQCFCTNNPDFIAECSQLCSNKRPPAIRYTLTSSISASLVVRLFNVVGELPASFPFLTTSPTLNKQVVVR